MMRTMKLITRSLLSSLIISSTTFSLGASDMSAASGVRYFDPVFTNVDVISNYVYATAPALVGGQPEQLRLDVFTPSGDTTSRRPVIVWVHGGGFKGGDKSALTNVAISYAKLGYVTVSINYRLNANNRCQELQDNEISVAEQIAVRAECTAAQTAAMNDAQAAIRAVRANAAILKIDPTRIAIGGFSAGAITALNVGYNASSPGDVGDNDNESSAVSAAISASGCTYSPDAIDPTDAPAFLVHTEFDQLVPYECALNTVQQAQVDGLAVQTKFYLGESLHANNMYAAHQSEIDPLWKAFLFEKLNLRQRIAAGSQTQISGLPNRTALVSVISTDSTGGGYIQVLPCGSQPGSSSNINTDMANQTRAGLALVRFDSVGHACLYNQTETHLVADLQGYLAETAIDDTVDTRLVDTRINGQQRRPAKSRTVIRGRANATGVISLTVTDSVSGGYLQVLACNQAPGEYSNLNTDRAGQTRAGLAFARFDSNGEACVFNETPAHIIVDLQGYMADTGIDDVADTRLIDTRVSIRPASASKTVIHGRSNTTAIVSLVATQTAAGGYLQILGCSETPGQYSNLNADEANQTIAGLAFVRFNNQGEACVFTEASAHLVVDLQAYLTNGAFDDLPDMRVLDTRPV
jgi:predicted esterase